MLRLFAGPAAPALRRLPGGPALAAAPAAAALGGGHGAVVADAALRLELLQSLAGPFAPLQARWAKKSKRKKLPKKDDKTPEQKAANGGPKERVFDRYLHASETPFEMKRVISKHLRNLTSDGRWNIRRKKDIATHTNYRVKRAAGMTHDDPQEDVDRRGFVTPLTELQDGAALPKSPLHRRFRFPHTLSYKVYWGPPSVEQEPNKHEGSMVGCTVAARLDDMPMTQQQKERLVDIVGPSCVDEATNVLALEADVFPDRNHNAALAGDMFEKLLREATLPPPAAELWEPASTAAAAAEQPQRGSGKGGGGGRRSPGEARPPAGGGGRRPAAPRSGGDCGGGLE